MWPGLRLSRLSPRSGSHGGLGLPPARLWSLLSSCPGRLLTGRRPKGACAATDCRCINGREVRDMAAVFGCAFRVGLITFSPLLPRAQYTSPLGFLAI